jgi:hypothetical protein
MNPWLLSHLFSCLYTVSIKHIRDRFFISFYIYYVLYCIYYETDLRDHLLYSVVSLACTSLTLKSSLELSLGVSEKIIRDRLFTKRPTLYKETGYSQLRVSEKITRDQLFTKKLIVHSFLYILYLNYIYYVTNLRDSTLYYVNSWAVSFTWRTVLSCTCNISRRFLNWNWSSGLETNYRSGLLIRKK